MGTQVTLNSGSVDSAGSLLLKTNGTTTAVTLDTAQNMGLGVTPSSWDSTYKALQVGARSMFYGIGSEANMANNAYYNSGYKYVASSAAGLYTIDANVHKWYNAASGTAGNAITFTQAMTLDASGNLGVGTTSPGRKLDVYGAAQFKDASGIANTIWSEVSTGVAGIGTNNNYPLALVTNGTERARIDTSGNLLVGVTSFSNNGGGTRLCLGGANSNITTSAPQTTAFNHYELYNNNGRVGSISTNGSATTYSTSSDYRLKNSVAPMTGALAKVAALKPVTYKWNADGSDGEGFIAHELAEVVPDAVVGEKDAVDADGNPQYQGIDTSFLVATLTAAIQELKAEFDAYKASHP